MRRVVCVFCRQERKRGKEHVWPQWLQEQVEGGTALRHETHCTLAGTRVTRRTLQNKSLVLGDVCEHCNSGWMSELECDAITVLRPLLSAPVILGSQLTTAGCVTLARWAFKTAIVRNWGTNYRMIVPAEHFALLHDKRSIAESTFIDLAVCPASRRLGAVQSQMATGLVTRGDEGMIAAALSNVYNITLGVGPLLLRVVHLPFVGYEVKSFLAGGRQALRLWPNPNAVTFSLENVVENLHDFGSSTFFDEAIIPGRASLGEQ